MADRPQVMISDSAGVRRHLDSVMKQAESRNMELKRLMEEDSERLEEKSPARPGGGYIGADNMTLKFGNNKFHKIFRVKGSFSDLLTVARTTIGSTVEAIGFLDGNNRTTWIRTSSDISSLSRWYFGHGLSVMRIVDIPPKDIKVMQKFCWGKEVQTKDNNITFRCELAGPSKPLLFFSVPFGVGFAEGRSCIESVLGQIKSFVFTDDEDDLVDVNDGDSWDYCVRIAEVMKADGRFPTAMIEL